jgi:adenylate cyclase
MRTWNRDYWDELSSEFKNLTRNLKSKLDQVVSGKVVPSIDNMPIGSARKLDAAVMFFDLRGSSNWSVDVAVYVLNIVIPTMMRIVHDHDGYIEKNTGDGVMAIFAFGDGKKTCKSALQCAMASFCTLREVINPHLLKIGLPTIDARIGIDFGEIVVSRVGVPQGSARQARSFLTAIGPAPNIACRLQEQAGTNEIWVGNAVKAQVPAEWADSFLRKFPSEWNWVQKGNVSQPYEAWHFCHQLAVPIPSVAPILPRGLLALAPPTSQPSALRSFFDRPPGFQPPPLRGLLGIGLTEAPAPKTPDHPIGSILSQLLKKKP